MTMVTLRAFFTPAEAALAKSLLDDHGIVCSVADEHAFLYGGAPLAMPVRLIVAEDQAEEASRILDHPPDGLPPKATDQGDEETEAMLPAARAAGRNNPWEFLVLALFVSMPGLLLLSQKNPLVVFAPERGLRGRTVTFIPPANAHLLGFIVIGIALFLVFLFFYVRRAIAAEANSVVADQAQPG